jgi:hypothetical protein
LFKQEFSIFDFPYWITVEVQINIIIIKRQKPKLTSTRSAFIRKNIWKTSLINELKRLDVHTSILKCSQNLAKKGGDGGKKGIGTLFLGHDHIYNKWYILKTQFLPWL